MTGEPGPPGAFGAPFDCLFRVRFDEAGADGLARPSTLLRFAQDAAWQHGAALGLDRAWYEEHQLVWLVRAVDLEILRPIPLGASLRLSTAVIGHRRIWARRRVEMRLDTPRDPSPAAVALTDWVLADAAGRIQRIPESFAQIFAVPPATFEITRVPLGPASADAARSVVSVRPQELDPNGHLNNAVHLDWLDEAVAATGAAPATGHLPRRYLVEYLAPLEPGARVEAAVWRAEGDWVARLTRQPDGPEAARARLSPG